MLARDFAAVLGEVEPHLPLSGTLEKADQESPRWYFSQRTHLVGYISRKAYNEGWDTLDVSKVWSGITRPEARLWVIEALGMIGSEGHEVVNTLLNDLPYGKVAENTRRTVSIWSNAIHLNPSSKLPQSFSTV